MQKRAQIWRPLVAGLLLVAGSRGVGAQLPDSAPAPTGAFIGRVIATLDSAPARSVEVRLIYVDSTKKYPGADSLDIFTDSLRTRVGVTDSTGAFYIRRLAAGQYLVRLRRIGFTPVDGVLTVGSDTVRADLRMEVTSRTLAQVTIVETTLDRVTETLQRVGYIQRSHLGISKTFVDRKEILRRRRDRLGDLLSAYGIHSGEVVLDRMTMDFMDVIDYPTELVIGIEIYQHNRPIEFNMTRRSTGDVWRSGGMNPPLVLVWTYLPGH